VLAIGDLLANRLAAALLDDLDGAVRSGFDRVTGGELSHHSHPFGIGRDSHLTTGSDGCMRSILLNPTQNALSCECSTMVADRFRLTRFALTLAEHG